MILYTASAGVEFLNHVLNHVLVSHVWNQISGLVIPET